jgi:hypothetical protein
LLVQISEALKLYTEQDKDKKKFSLMPCWNILKGEDKWAAKMVELAELEKLEKSKKKQKAAKVSRPRDEEGTNNEQAVTDAVGQETQARKRSDGIKKVKENLRRGGGKLAWRRWTRCGQRRRSPIRKKRRQNRRGLWLLLT